MVLLPDIGNGAADGRYLRVSPSQLSPEAPVTRRTNSLNDELYQYLLDVSVDEHDCLRRLRGATADLPLARMQIGPEQGQFLALLVELIGAHYTLEVGTFTGYSALAVALSLPFDGRVIACDVSEEWTSIGKPFWEEAGQAHKIELRLGPALETLDGLIASGHQGRYDFAFIDADKTSYQGYLDRCWELVRHGGLIAIDNTLWKGRVIDPSDTDPDTEAIRAFNAKLKDDHRFTVSMLPIGDGLTLAKKR